MKKLTILIAAFALFCTGISARNAGLSYGVAGAGECLAAGDCVAVGESVETAGDYVVAACDCVAADGCCVSAACDNVAAYGDCVFADGDCVMAADGQAVKNNESGDNIVGLYSTVHGGENTKIRVTKTGDTYMAQVVWVENRLDKKGNVRLDEKNPDKSLRSVECDKIVLMKNLKYDSSKKMWGDTKIYDPTRGINANVKCSFSDDGVLIVKGSLLGITVTLKWTPIGE